MIITCFELRVDRARWRMEWWLTYISNQRL